MQQIYFSGKLTREASEEHTKNSLETFSGTFLKYYSKYHIRSHFEGAKMHIIPTVLNYYNLYIRNHREISFA